MSLSLSETLKMLLKAKPTNLQSEICMKDPGRSSCFLQLKLWILFPQRVHKTQKFFWNVSQKTWCTIQMHESLFPWGKNSKREHDKLLPIFNRQLRISMATVYLSDLWLRIATPLFPLWCNVLWMGVFTVFSTPPWVCKERRFKDQKKTRGKYSYRADLVFWSEGGPSGVLTPGWPWAQNLLKIGVFS